MGAEVVEGVMCGLRKARIEQARRAGWSPHRGRAAEKRGPWGGVWQY